MASAWAAVGQAEPRGVGACVSLLSSPLGRAWDWNRPSHGKAGGGKTPPKAPRNRGSNFKK